MYIVEYLGSEQLTKDVKEIVDNDNKNAVILHEVDSNDVIAVKHVLRGIVERQNCVSEEDLKMTIGCLDESDDIEYFFQNNDLSNLFEGKE